MEEVEEADQDFEVIVSPLDDRHFSKPYEEQLIAHKRAVEYLFEAADNFNFRIKLLSPVEADSPRSFPGFEAALKRLAVHDHKAEALLNPKVFCWEETTGVSQDIQDSARTKHEVHIYSAASQFNGCEATSRFTPRPGKAYNLYMADPTQGPQAQLQFHRNQVEALNVGANIGFNGLIHLLDDTTASAVKHGYFTPETSDQASKLISKLKNNQEASKINYLATSSIPEKWNKDSTSKWAQQQPDNTEIVHQVLVAAPAFGGYDVPKTEKDVTPAQKGEITYHCALRSYQAQFRYLFQVATENEDDPNDGLIDLEETDDNVMRKPVVLKATAPGLGVFGNDVKAVAAGFLSAALEFQEQLEDCSIHHAKVKLQVYMSRGGAKEMADMLKLVQSKKSPLKK